MILIKVEDMTPIKVEDMTLIMVVDRSLIMVVDMNLIMVVDKNLIMVVDMNHMDFIKVDIKEVDIRLKVVDMFLIMEDKMDIKEVVDMWLMEEVGKWPKEEDSLDSNLSFREDSMPIVEYLYVDKFLAYFNF